MLFPYGPDRTGISEKRRSKKKKEDPFFLQHEEKRSQVDFMEIIGFFSAARITGYASRNSKIFQTFFCSMEKSKVKLKSKKNKKTFHNFFTCLCSRFNNKKHANCGTEMAQGAIMLLGLNRAGGVVSTFAATGG